ncbi:SCAN domain-containing protein 3-like [Tachysurus ichikawai]
MTTVMKLVNYLRVSSALNIAEFLTEATEVFLWANAASLQTELIELQENLELQESHCDPVTFWMKMVTAAGVPLLQKMALHLTMVTIFI